MASQASGAPKGNQEPLQSHTGVNINLEQVFFIKNSLAEAKTPLSHPTGSPPRSTATEKESTAIDVFMDGVDALDMKDFEEAAELFEKAAAMEPQNL